MGADVAASSSDEDSPLGCCHGGKVEMFDCLRVWDDAGSV